MYTQCPRCGAMLPDPGRDFPCPRCQEPVRSAGQGFVADDEAMGPAASVQMSGEPGWKALLRSLQQLARLGAFVLFAVSLLLCFGALFIGIPQVFGGAPGSEQMGVFYILTPSPLGLFGIDGIALAVYHLFLAVIITGSLVYLLVKERARLGPLLSGSLARYRSPDRRVGLGVVQLPQVFFAIFFFDIIFALVLYFTGTSTRTPAFETYPDWYLYFTFAHASVYEEFAARTLLLGIPLLLAYVMAYSRRARPANGPPADILPPRPPYAPAAPQEQSAPAVAPAPYARSDALIDAQPDDPAKRVAPKQCDGRAPIAATPSFAAPSAEAPPVQAPGLMFPRIPEKGQALILATAERPVPESLSPGPQHTGPAPPFGRPTQTGADAGDVTFPYPPPVVMPPLREARPPVQTVQLASRPNLAGYLRSRTTNGLWGYFLGGGFDIGPLEAFFIVGSALMFGYAHVAGWDLWKMLPTFVAGLGFGYLFLKVGIHAAILLHFSFDYLSLGQALLPGIGLMELLLLGLWTVVGAFYFGHYAVQAFKWLMGQLGQTSGHGTDEGT